MDKIKFIWIKNILINLDQIVTIEECYSDRHEIYLRNGKIIMINDESYEQLFKYLYKECKVVQTSPCKEKGD